MTESETTCKWARGYVGLTLVEEESGKMASGEPAEAARYEASLYAPAVVLDIMVPLGHGEEEWFLTSILSDGCEQMACEAPLTVVKYLSERYPRAWAKPMKALSLTFQRPLAADDWPRFIAVRADFQVGEEP